MPQPYPCGECMGIFIASTLYKFKSTDQEAHAAGRSVYQDAIFDTKKKALPGVELPKRAKNKDFQQIFGLLEVLFRYVIVCHPMHHNNST